MTLDDVRRAVQTLKAQHVYPSQRKVLEHLGETSKRQVAALLYELTTEDPTVLQMPPPGAHHLSPAVGGRDL
jgi:hypothetical protein